MSRPQKAGMQATAKPPVPAPDIRRLVLICLGLVTITIAVFGQTLHNQFINCDDNDYVFDNTIVRQGLTLKGTAWAFTFQASNWHPMTWLSHMLDCQLYGLHPAGHHLTSVILHAATVVALFLVLREMTSALWRSAFVAAVFAIHPLRVESVAWVAERKDVLSALFFVLTLWAYARYVRGIHRKRYYASVMIFFVLGLMSKPMLVTLPAVLLLLDFWPLQRKESAGKLIVEKLPMAALSSAACALTLIAQNGAMQPVAAYGLSLRLENALISYVTYLHQMLYPAGLAIFYPLRLDGFPTADVILAGAFLAGVSGIAFWQRRMKPWLCVGWAWYLIMLLPVIGIVQVGSQAHADRYTYLPQIGLCIVATWGAVELSGNRLWIRSALGVGAAAVLAAFAALAWRQTTYWKDSLTLWTHALQCAPENATVQNNLGLAFADTGQPSLALQHYERAVQLWPAHVEALNNLGLLLAGQGKTAEAITYYQKSLHYDSNYWQAQNNLGVALSAEGRTAEAIEHFNRALALKPDYAHAERNLGNTLLADGKLTEAIEHFQRALQSDPADSEAVVGLGLALTQERKWDEARIQFQRALAIKLDCAEAHDGLGVLLSDQQNWSEAANEFKHALVIRTNYPSAQNHLGSALAEQGNYSGAIEHFKSAIALKRDFPEAYCNLGYALASEGRFIDAEAQFAEALQFNQEFVRAHYGLGTVLAKEGKLAQAADEYEEALRLDPKFVAADNELGLVLVAQGRVEDAIFHYQHAAMLKPDYAEAQVNWGSALASQGKWAGAILKYKEALRLKPDYLQARLDLGIAFAQQREWQAAIVEFQQALALANAAKETSVAEAIQGELKACQSALAGNHAP